jgi:hypothetical protein
MADILCGYTADRDETLVAYLYGDIEPAQRGAFEAHIATCERCRHDVAALQDVRQSLQHWGTPPLGGPLATRVHTSLPAVETPPARRPTIVPDLPMWARAVAAILVLGVSAGIAGLDVRYDGSGLTVRTGWSRAVAPPAAIGSNPALGGTTSEASTPWRADLEALEQRMQSELQKAVSTSASTNGSTNTAVSAGVASAGDRATIDVQLLHKVRALVDESERRQRNELALRIGELVQEFDAKRGTDLANVRNMKTIQSATGVEIVRQQQWLDLLTKASLQR